MYFCRFLAPIGPKGTVQGRKETAGKDEHFTLLDAHPQITLFAKKKKKFVSGKQGKIKTSVLEIIHRWLIQYNASNNF